MAALVTATVEFAAHPVQRLLSLYLIFSFFCQQFCGGYTIYKCHVIYTDTHSQVELFWMHTSTSWNKSTSSCRPLPKSSCLARQLAECRRLSSLLLSSLSCRWRVLSLLRCLMLDGGGTTRNMGASDAVYVSHAVLCAPCCCCCAGRLTLTQCAGKENGAL